MIAKWIEALSGEEVHQVVKEMAANEALEPNCVDIDFLKLFEILLANVMYIWSNLPSQEQPFQHQLLWEPSYYYTKQLGINLKKAIEIKLPYLTLPTMVLLKCHKKFTTDTQKNN